MTSRPRVRTLTPLTDGELAVIRLLAEGKKYHDIAPLVGLQRPGVVWRVQQAAAKIPGTLPMRAKCIAWWRGADRRTLGA